jgi:ubiquinone biosynthesis protein
MASPRTRAAHAPAAGPVRLRQFLVRQGPIFVKIGQFLALRPDLLPAEYCDELLKLTDQVDGFASDVAGAIITADLGKSPEQLFAWFNPRPFAAASLAQVHVATLANGRRVAVKVQRPGVREAVDRDLRRARRFGRLLELANLVEIVSTEDLIAEIRRWLDDELDCQRELANVKRLYGLSAQNPRMRVPQPFPELSGARVVTTEFLEGVPMSELLRRGGDGAADAGRVSFDRERLAENLLWSVLEQIFRYEFFHADTHPGNLLALPGDVVGFVDFGFVEALDATVRQKQSQYLAALYLGDVDAMYRGLLQILEVTPDSDVDAFRQDFVALTRAWTRDKDVPSADPQQRSPLADYMSGTMRAIRRRRLRVPLEVLSLYRALLTAETVAHGLGGRADLRAVGAKFFTTTQYDQLLRLFQPAVYQSLLLDVLTLAREGPGHTQQILSDLADERFMLHVRSEDSTEDRRLENNRFQLLSACIVLLALAVLIGSRPDAVIAGRIDVRYLLWGAFGAALAVIVALWRRLP